MKNVFNSIILYDFCKAGKYRFALNLGQTLFNEP